ncbi:MAG: hypothetical protein PWQ67_1654 [Clostridia bacterium]|nr:hypothetical protein [Clostridia bacterium]MDN5323200.1 hypothetical protein [Clostridia bacterium]
MLRERLLDIIDELWPEIWQTALYIYDNPELGGQEYKAVSYLGKVLERFGYKYLCPYLGLDTSFKAQVGNGKPVIYFIAEYDALPEIGHGCGHHMIAGASVGAAISLAVLKQELSGSIVVLGTPAEETAGAKVLLLEKGAFIGCDAVLMFHPGQNSIINISSQALEALEVTYSGFHGHSARGAKGNPLVSLVYFFQQTLDYNKAFFPQQQIEGVITFGGVTPNLIPDKAVGKFYIRAGSTTLLKKTIKDFKEMLEKTAEVNKTEAVIRQFEPRYLPMQTNKKLAQIFKEQVNLMGMEMNMDYRHIVGSMDMGNVSWQIPSIHPYLPLGNGKVSAHSLEFKKIAGSYEGEKTMKLATQALALTALELLTKPQMVELIWKEHNSSVASYSG